MNAHNWSPDVTVSSFQHGQKNINPSAENTQTSKQEVGENLEYEEIAPCQVSRTGRRCHGLL